MTFQGWRIIDTAITPELQGTIVTADADHLAVIVTWDGHDGVATLRVRDIAAGRYQLVPR